MSIISMKTSLIWRNINQNAVKTGTFDRTHYSCAILQFMCCSPDNFLSSI